MKLITASIIQGLAIRTASSVATAGDLNTVNPGNRLVKFADPILSYHQATPTHVRLRLEMSRPGCGTQEFGVVAELLCAPNAWWSFITATEQQRIEAFFSRSKRCGFCHRSMSSALLPMRNCSIPFYYIQVTHCTVYYRHLHRETVQYHSTVFKSHIALFITATYIEKLFNTILLYSSHTLHCLLPPSTVASHYYNLRPRTHNRTLPRHTGHLTDYNFLNRVLFMKI